MATVFEDCTTEEQHYVVRFVWAKGLSPKDIREEMFPMLIEKCGNRFADDEEVETEMRK
jgi:hypothetical protein